ncbi:MAG: hypothetical protein FWG90_11230 [Oscillospiraceae bacterium]|nr:hypothetical protein [Oscillospiraceae bacterium]
MDKGLKILMNTFWDKGWRNPTFTEEEFLIAKNEGYMFDKQEFIPHDEDLRNAKETVDKVDKKDVANAFLYSLSTKKLEYRSALGSYYYIKSVPKHEYTIRTTNSNPDIFGCQVCGWIRHEDNPNIAIKYPNELFATYENSHGLNIMNFRRYKWGGVNNDELLFAKFDLEQFLKLPKVTPKSKDIEIMKSMLEVVKKLPPNAKAGKYEAQIRTDKILRSNPEITRITLETLAICDIFNSEHEKGYLHSFTNCGFERDSKELRNNYRYPLNYWRASDGIHTAALAEVFGID